MPIQTGHGRLTAWPTRKLLDERRRRRRRRLKGIARLWTICSAFTSAAPARRHITAVQMRIETA
jgi:hypothetical protein